MGVGERAHRVGLWEKGPPLSQQPRPQTGAQGGASSLQGPLPPALCPLSGRSHTEAQGAWLTQHTPPLTPSRLVSGRGSEGQRASSSSEITHDFRQEALGGAGALS